MLALPNATLPTSLWPNGAGRKADLAGADGWLVGFAWLEVDAPFSRLPGMSRTITLVEGPGFTLEIDGHPLPVTTRFAPGHFDGGASTYCRVAGPSRVLNVMTDRVRYSHEIAIVTGSTSQDASTVTACLVVVLSGTARVREADATVTLGTLDAAQLHAPADIQVGADSRLAILTITRRPSPT